MACNIQDCRRETMPDGRSLALRMLGELSPVHQFLVSLLDAVELFPIIVGSHQFLPLCAHEMVAVSAFTINLASSVDRAPNTPFDNTLVLEVALGMATDPVIRQTITGICTRDQAYSQHDALVAFSLAAQGRKRQFPLEWVNDALALLGIPPTSY